ncbi:MAG: RluA family pseudouridine synthase [Spirochaetaceae bacterium]|nr:RluA family pseudouridine synthase [Spirochaetaceae bacterium]
MDDEGRRLDRVLRKSCPQIPISAIYRLLRQGEITLNGKAALASARIKAGDLIQFTGRSPDFFGGNKTQSKIDKGVPDAAPAYGKDIKITFKEKRESLYKNLPSPKLDILFENKDILVLNKSTGTLCHGEKSLASSVEAYLEHRIPCSLSFKPGPLHRLDRETSGLLLFSKSLSGARYISYGLHEGLFHKNYLAIVEGIIKEEELWEDRLLRDKDLKTTFVNPQDSSTAKQAVSMIRRLAVSPSCSFVRVEIKTGRTHQIRSQAAYHNHPLLGDTKYSTHTPQKSGGSQFFLHSHCIEFPPDNPLCLPQKITAPLPKIFEKKIASLFGFTNADRFLLESC